MMANKTTDEMSRIMSRIGTRSLSSFRQTRDTNMES
jgi:hypothetical protein